MATKKVEAESPSKKRQEKITFQPWAGFREIIATIRKDGSMGPRPSEADVINEALRLFFEDRGYLKSKK